MSFSATINLPSKQVGMLVAAVLAGEEKSYAINFHPEWTAVFLSNIQTRESAKKEEAYIISVVEQVKNDIKTRMAYLHCAYVPFLCSARGESEVTTVEDFYQVEITFTSNSLPIQDFSMAVQSSRQETSFICMQDLHAVTVSGLGSSDSRNPFHRSACFRSWNQCQPNGTLSPLGCNESQIIEKLFQFGGSQVLLGGHYYTVDFSTMEVKANTGQSAQLQRDPTISGLPEHRVEVKVKGMESRIADALSNLKQRLNEGFRKLSIPCSPAIVLNSYLKQQIINNCRQYCIKFSFDTIDSQHVLNIEGTQEYVECVHVCLDGFVQRLLAQAPLELAMGPPVVNQQLLGLAVAPPPVVNQQASVLPFLQNLAQPVPGTPRLWTPQPLNCVFNEVVRNSQEWNEIVAMIRATLTTVNVMKVDRVQNRTLWARYNLEGRQMHERNQGTIAEKYLFHGTSRTDPYEIARADSGIDFRYSSRERQLMWGSGAYFAIKASYSDRFSFKLENGSRQMMLVSVLTGITYPYGSRKDPNLTRPPERLPGRLYDTVRGESADSEIYVVYDHFKSCPAYIITYTK